MSPSAHRDFTDEQLRAAWTRYRRQTWPATFEATMADDFYARLVRLHATHMSRPQQEPAPTPAPAAPAPARRPAFTPPPPHFVDRKRAAAGDFDD